MSRPGKKILIIEDDPYIAKFLASRLRHSGYDVISAKDGREGVTKAVEENPDLVITDLALPYITGNVIVRMLRASEEHKKIPIIMLSAFIHAEMGRGVEVPADAYIPKPFDPEKLLAKIRELLSSVI